MDNELRELRLALQLPAKEIVAVIQELYPKYDKTMQSKCERSDEYGVSLQPDAMKAVLAKLAPERIEQRKRQKNGRHRLTCRISCRLEDADYAALQQHTKADGYATMQDWIADIVREYLKSKGAIENV